MVIFSFLKVHSSLYPKEISAVAIAIVVPVMMKCMGIIVVVLHVSVFINQALNSQNCEIKLDEKTNGTHYQYTTMPVNITIMKAESSEVCGCTWRVNEMSIQECGCYISCTINLLLNSTVMNVDCLTGGDLMSYIIFFNYSE